MNLYVSPDAETSQNTFSSISEAILRIPEHNCSEVTIRVAPGIFREKVTLNRPHVHLLGESARDCVITFGDYAKAAMPDGGKRGTFRSYTMLVDADDVTLENLTIENDAAPRERVGQAIALYADGDRLTVKNCRLLGHQDTLFTGPLPPEPIEPGSFAGPKEFAPRRVGRQYYKDCYICGDIDFIFGSATAYFEGCELASILWNDASPVQGYATAASTPEGMPYGYVFHGCRFTYVHENGTGRAMPCVYLGRPWRDYAKTVLIDCCLGEHVHPDGFHDWDKPIARKNCFYAEYKSHGPGACAHRADFVRSLTDGEALAFSKGNVLGDFAT